MNLRNVQLKSLYIIFILIRIHYEKHKGVKHFF